MPLPKFLDKFPNEDVNNLIKTGNISSSFDDFSVLAIDKDEAEIDSSVITFPMTVDDYDNTLVAENFTVEFEEFVVAEPTGSIEQVDGVTDEDTTDEDNISNIEKVAELEQQVANLSTELDEAGGDQALIGASKDQIIKLRIDLGQGSTEDDFNETFPYLPLNDPENNV